MEDAESPGHCSPPDTPDPNSSPRLRIHLLRRTFCSATFFALRILLVFVKQRRRGPQRDRLPNGGDITFVVDANIGLS